MQSIPGQLPTIYIDIYMYIYILHNDVCVAITVFSFTAATAVLSVLHSAVVNLDWYLLQIHK